MAAPTKNYGLPQWDGNEYLKRTAMNEAFAKIDTALHRVETSAGATVEEALKSFEFLSNTVGNKTTDSEVVSPEGLSTYTAIVTDSAGHEVARKVDVEGVQADGKAMWTTTITIGAKVVTIVDKETANGWTREVR